MGTIEKAGPWERYEPAQWQKKLGEKKCKSRQARENAHNHVMIGDW